MYLSAQRVSFGASTPVSVSSDIPLFNGEWRLSLKSIFWGEVWGEAIVKGALNCIIPKKKTGQQRLTGLLDEQEVLFPQTQSLLI